MNELYSNPARALALEHGKMSDDEDGDFVERQAEESSDEGNSSSDSSEEEDEAEEEGKNLGLKRNLINASTLLGDVADLIDDNPVEEEGGDTGSSDNSDAEDEIGGSKKRKRSKNLSMSQCEPPYLLPTYTNLYQALLQCFTGTREEPILV